MVPSWKGTVGTGLAKEVSVSTLTCSVLTYRGKKYKVESELE